MKIKYICTHIHDVLKRILPDRLSRKALVIVAAIILAASFWLGVSTTADKTGAQGSMNRSLPALSGEKAISYLKKSGEYETLAAAMTAARYEAEQSDKSATATNYANQLRSTFTPEGLRLESNANGGQWESRWRLQTLGYGKDQLTVDDGVVQTTGNRVTIKHRISSPIESEIRNPQSAIVEEWFNNTSGGLEHGFTLPGRLSKNIENLRLTIAVDGDLTAQADTEGQSLRLVNKQGEAVVNYEKLKVWDANGVEIVARMTTVNGAVILDVEDAAAKYPLVIDPTFSAAAKLVASEGAADDFFGSSVAISGDTVIIGSPFDDVLTTMDQGSAYIFVRGTNGLWTQQTKLTVGGVQGDRGGTSVAISGDTVVFGVPFDHLGTMTSRGSVFVYVRSGTTWTYQDKLNASDNATDDSFGSSVDISGDTVIVGAFLDDIGANVNEGSAYVFVRSGTNWSQQQKLTAIGGGASDEFGASVAIANSTVIVGAFANDIGGMGDRGSAYVFTRSGTTWTQQQELFATDGAAGDRFGGSVDIATGFMSAASAIIGAYGDNIGGMNLQGSAYVFTRSGTTWTQQQKLTANDGAADDRFGYSVAILGGTAIVGALFNSVGSNSQQGSSYVFTRSGGTTWTERQKLIAFDGAASDFFGNSVAISGDTAIVGVYHDAVGGISDQGSAYIFRLGSKPSDFDDDGKADVSVFRPSNGVWYLQRSTAGFTFVQFGQSGDIPVAGDFDGDGETDTAVWRPSSGTWYLLQSTAGFAAAQFGQSGDIPLPADSNGDGKSDIRLFRPSNGTWYGLNISNGQSGAFQFGANGDLPVAGNFDGDSFADLAVFRPSNGTWYLMQTTGGFAYVQFGQAGDRPVAGDFDGDGKSDVAVFRPSNGTWYRLDSSTNQFVGVAFGQNGDIPAPGDYDGDGKTDIAVFRPSNGYWYLLQTSAGFAAVQFGAAGDIPAPAQP